MPNHSTDHKLLLSRKVSEGKIILAMAAYKRFLRKGQAPLGHEQVISTVKEKKMQDKNALAMAA